VRLYTGSASVSTVSYCNIKLLRVGFLTKVSSWEEGKQMCFLISVLVLSLAFPVLFSLFWFLLTSTVAIVVLCVGVFRVSFSKVSCGMSWAESLLSS
jgi:hypothetical protein